MSERGVYRGIYSALADDPDYQELSAKERLVLLTARICKQAGPAGIFRYYPALLAAQTGLSLKDIELALGGLGHADWIRHEGPILWIRNALRHDPSMHLKNKKHLHAITEWLKELPRLQIVLDFCRYYEIAQPFDSLSDSHTNGSRYIGRLKTEDRRLKTEKSNTMSGLTTPDDPSLGDAHSNGKGHDHGPAAMRTAARDLLAYLNKKAGKHFQTTPSNLGYIIARLREGATVDQCWAIIGMKSAEWKDDRKMRKFLRPETLFNETKFASYQGELPATAFEEPPP